MTLFYVIIAFISELKKIQSSATQHFQSILNGHERLKLQLESQKKQLELRRIELEKREAHNESERKKLEEDMNKVMRFSIFFV
jgi:cell shape-determining protein MreC